MGPRAALFTMVEHTLLPCTTVLAKCIRLVRKRRPHLHRASRMPILACATLCFVPEPRLLSWVPENCPTRVPEGAQQDTHL